MKLWNYVISCHRTSPNHPLAPEKPTASRFVFLLFLLIVFSALALGQDQYRSLATGSWNTAGTWEKSTDGGGTWATSITTPGSGTGTPGAATDVVLVRDGHMVTINTNSTIAQLTAGEGASGILRFDNTGTVRTLTVSGSVTIAASGKIDMATGGTNTTSSMLIGGNMSISNSATFDGLVAASHIINVTFNSSSSSDQTVSSSGSPTLVRFNTVTLNRGGLARKVVCSVANTIGVANGLTLTSGTWEQSSGNITPTGAQTIANTGALIFSGSGGLVGVNASVTLNGSLTINSSGNVNIGTSSGNSLTYATGSSLTIQTGTVNIAGRFAASSTTQTTTFSMSGGNLNVSKVGNGSSSTGEFDIPASGSSFTMSGGTIVFQNASTATTKLDYRNVAGTTSISGGTVQFGNASTTSSPTFNLGISAGASSVLPDMTINANGTPTVQLNTAITVKGNISIASGTTLDASSQSISLAGNWSNSGTFTSGTQAVTFNGSSAQTYTQSVSSTFSSLTMNNSAGLTLNNDIRVNGILTFTSGNISTGANTVTIGSSGSVSRTSGHVVGNLKKGIDTGPISRTFEIGDASNYTPVSVNFGSVSVSGDLTAKTTADDHANIGTSLFDPNKTVNRYWTLTNSGIAFDSYSATFTFVAGDVDGGANTSNFVVQKYDGSSWSSPTTGTRTSTSMQITGESSFSDFAIGELNPVPTITLIGTLSDFGTLVIGNTSAEQSYSVAGTNLTNDIAIIAPTDFEISTTSGSGFGSSLTLTQSSGTVSSTTIFVRFAPSSSGAKSGNITHTSTGATTKNQAVSGTGTNAPTITVSVTSLPSFGLVVAASQSSEQSYTVSGANLTDDILVTALTGFEVSTTSGSGFGLSVTLTQASGSVATTTIYARFAPALADGAHSGNISQTSSGATTKNVAVSGTAIATEPTTQSTISFGAVGGSTAVVNFSGGNGARRIVVARSGSAVSFTPTDAVAPSGANSSFVAATDQGSGNKIVFDGTGTTVTVTGLSGNTTYHFASYEYNVGTGASQNYLTTSPGTGNTTTAVTIFTYRSVQSGNWNATSTWESSEDGTNWLAAAGTPTSSDGSITIRNGHTVSVTAAVSADEVAIQSGGNLTVNSGIALTVNNGTGDDIAVQGGGVFVLGSGTAATTPTFGGGSTININSGGILRVAGSGITGAGAGVNVLNFVYQNASILEYTLTSAFSTSGVTYFSNADAVTIPVFRITAAISGSAGAAAATVFNGVFECGTGASVTWQNAGTKTFRNGIRGSGAMSQGTAGQLIINGSTSELGGGILTLGTNGLSVSSANTSLSSNKQIDGGPITVTGTLNCGTNEISGSGSFTLSSGATLGIGSPDGIKVSGSGNIRVTGTRTYSTAANYTYNGSALQEAGNGLPSSVNNLTINNSAGVFTDNNVTVDGTLTLTNGALSIGDHPLTINGAITTASGSLTGGATSSIIIGGTAAQATLPAVTLGSLTLNRANGAILGGATDINSSLTLTSGVLGGGGNLTFETGASVTRSAGSLTGAPTFNGAVDLSYTATLTTGTEMPTSSTGLHNLTINPTTGIVTLNAEITVNGDFTLTSGTFNVTSSHTLTLKAGVGGVGTLTSSATGTVSYAQASVGQDVLAGNYGSLTLSDFNKDFPPGGTIGIAGTFSPGSATAHSLSGSTVNFNGSGAQTIPAFNGTSGYYKLTVSNGSTKTAGANLWVQSLLSIAASTILADGGYTIYVYGDVDNNGQHTGSGKIRLGVISHVLSGSGSYTNLQLNDVGATLSGADLTIDGTLTLTSGKITTGAQAVVIGASGSISGANSTSYVVGTLKKSFSAGVQSFTFAIGDAVNYSPVEIVSLTVTAPGTLTGTTTQSAHPNINISGFLPSKRVNRYWTFSPAGGLAVTTYDATFNFVPADVDPGVNINNFFVKRYDGSAWLIATAGSRTATSTQGTGMASFSDFAVGEIAVGVASTLSVTSGNNQTGAVTLGLANPYVVTIGDGLNGPVAGSLVTFSITGVPSGATGQSLSVASTTTGVNGQAATVLTLGNKPGPYTVTASTGILPPVTFSATAINGAPSSIAKVSGDNQQGPVLSQLSPFVVAIRDAGGNPLSGITVNFVLNNAPSGQSGSGLSRQSVATDNNGQASTALVLGTKPGPYGVVGSVPNGGNLSAAFAATATTGLPSQLVKIGGDNQNGPVNTTLSTPCVVQVLDIGGNPLSGIPVSFSVFSAPVNATGQQVSPSGISTNSQGQASTLLTLGNQAGQYRVSASSLAIGGTFVTWTANATAPTAVEHLEGIPADFGLHPAYPNPFNPSTRIRFSLPEESRVKLLVYNVLGVQVDELLGATLSAGMYNVVWNADRFPSGSYIVWFQALSTNSSKQFTSTTRVMLLK